MDADDDNSAEPTMTLAFALDAIEAVERPQSVFADARRWSQHVGVVSRMPRAGQRFARDHDIDQDFFTGDRGVHESLAIVEHQFDAERYVLVGTTDDDQRVAEAAEWEYLSVEEAAEKADWELASPSGLLARLRRFLVGRL